MTRIETHSGYFHTETTKSKIKIIDKEMHYEITIKDYFTMKHKELVKKYKRLTFHVVYNLHHIIDISIWNFKEDTYFAGGCLNKFYYKIVNDRFIFYNKFRKTFTQVYISDVHRLSATMMRKNFGVNDKIFRRIKILCGSPINNRPIIMLFREKDNTYSYYTQNTCINFTREELFAVKPSQRTGQFKKISKSMIYKLRKKILEEENE